MKCKLTIYLADDDEDDRMMIRQAIETCITDVEIIEAIDGEDLINRVVAQDKGQPAVILTDMNMPRMNGLEATKLIKSVYFGDTGPAVSEHMGPAVSGIVGPLSICNNSSKKLATQLFFLS